MNDEFADKLSAAGEFFDAFRQLSEMLNGAVRTLVAEGWTEPQAREIVVASFVSNVRGNAR